MLIWQRSPEWEWQRSPCSAKPTCSIERTQKAKPTFRQDECYQERIHVSSMYTQCMIITTTITITVIVISNSNSKAVCNINRQKRVDIFIAIYCALNRRLSNDLIHRSKIMFATIESLCWTDVYIIRYRRRKIHSFPEGQNELSIKIKIASGREREIERKKERERKINSQAHDVHIDE